MVIVQEGEVKLRVEVGKISRKLPVFYNPEMGFNRDVSIWLLRVLNRKNMIVADPLAASGIRAVRFEQELPKSMIKKIVCNDISPTAIKYLKENIKRNRCRKISVEQEDANVFLRNNKPFDYIDIDPFGPPTPFLDAAVTSIRNHGILAITATDTAALAGTAVKACQRKYWATPLRNQLMHEIGLRILIRRAQLIAASYERALIPIYSYSKQHYMRVFFETIYRPSDVNAILKQHKQLKYDKRTQTVGEKGQHEFGPIWTGQLFDKKIAADIAKIANNPFTDLLADEARINSVGFLDSHSLARSKKKSVPALEQFIASYKKKGYKVARTHFSPNGIRISK